MVVTEADRARFWWKVDKNGLAARPELGRCWNWTGTVTVWGYGMFYFNGTNRRACAFRGARLAAKYGVHRDTIGRVVRREYWKELR